MNKLNGTICECLTAYVGKRNTVKDHLQTFEDHGIKSIAPCEKHLQGYNIVGSHLKNYDSTLVLSHFKGHAMGGFGGALKNMSIGFASRKKHGFILVEKIPSLKIFGRTLPHKITFLKVWQKHVNQSLIISSQKILHTLMLQTNVYRL